MKHYIKSIFAVLVLFFLAIQCFSQEIVRNVPKGEEAWRYLLKAQNAFDSGNYSDVIVYAEKAKSSARQKAKWELYTLDNTFKKQKVRNAGDKIDDVLPVLKELELKDAVEIVERRVAQKGRKYFDGKFSKIIEKEDYFSQCPEADFLIGKVYKIEGEFSLAGSYMEQAYAYWENLDVPEQKYDILYELAFLFYDIGDDEKFESYLLLILKDNPYFTDAGFLKGLLRLPNKDSREAMENFFKLYRAEGAFSIKALSLLSEYYMKNGEIEKAMECAALGSLTVVTKIENTLMERTHDYSYTSFARLLNDAASFPDIIEWGNSNDAWKIIYNFGDISASMGKLIFAREIFSVLSSCHKDYYWGRRAAQRLIN